MTWYMPYFLWGLLKAEAKAFWGRLKLRWRWFQVIQLYILLYIPMWLSIGQGILDIQPYNTTVYLTLIFHGIIYYCYTYHIFYWGGLNAAEAKGFKLSIVENWQLECHVLTTNLAQNPFLQFSRNQSSSFIDAELHVNRANWHKDIHKSLCAPPAQPSSRGNPDSK